MSGRTRVALPDSLFALGIWHGLSDLNPSPPKLEFDSFETYGIFCPDHYCSKLKICISTGKKMAFIPEICKPEA